MKMKVNYVLETVNKKRRLSTTAIKRTSVACHSLKKYFITSPIIIDKFIKTETQINSSEENFLLDNYFHQFNKKGNKK